MNKNLQELESQYEELNKKSEDIINYINVNKYPTNTLESEVFLLVRKTEQYKKGKGKKLHDKASNLLAKIKNTMKNIENSETPCIYKGLLSSIQDNTLEFFEKNIRIPFANNNPIKMDPLNIEPSSRIDDILIPIKNSRESSWNVDLIKELEDRSQKKHGSDGAMLTSGPKKPW